MAVETTAATCKWPLGLPCTRCGSETGETRLWEVARQRTFDVGLVCEPLQHRCNTVVPEQGYFSPNTGSLADVSRLVQ
jgi:hypothetical protein